MLAKLQPCGLYPGAQERGQQWLALCAAGISRHLLRADRALPLPGSELATGVGDIITEAAAVPIVGRGSHGGSGSESGGGGVGSRPPGKACGHPIQHPLVALNGQTRSPGERHSTACDLWWSSTELQAGGSQTQRSQLRRPGCPAIGETGSPLRPCSL